MTDSSPDFGDLDSLLGDGQAADHQPAPEPEAQPEAPRRRASRRTRERSPEPLFSWDQIARIVDFAEEFDNPAAADTRAAFIRAFGWPEARLADLDGLEAAQTMSDSAADIEAFALYSEVAEQLWGTPDFRTTIRLVARFAEVERPVLNALVIIVNSLADGSAVVATPGRNFEVGDVLAEIADALAATDRDRARALVAAIGRWLAIWPGAA